MILTIANQKGGVGKTTLTILLAISLYRKYTDIVLIDTDPQRSLFNNLTQINPKFDVTKEDLQTISKNLETYKNKIILVDTLPSTDINMVKLFNKSDVVLIPTGATLLDISASLNTIEILEDLKKPYQVVFNNIKSLNDLTDAKNAFLKKNIKITESCLWSRVAYSRIIQNNLEIADPKAVEELEKLINEIM